MPRLLPESLDRVRQNIQDSALGLFVTQGYAATTTRQIAAATGLTVGALYKHYASKETLFAAVAQAYQKRLGQDEQGNPLLTVIRNTRFPDDLPELAQAIKQVIADNRSYWLLWYIDVLEFGSKHFQQRLAPEALVGSPALERRFAALREAGTFRVDPKLAFVMIYMHLFNYFLVESVFSANQHYGVSEEEALDAIVEVFLHGMLNGSGHRA